MPRLPTKFACVALLIALDGLVYASPDVEVPRRLDSEDGATYTYRVTSDEVEPYGPSEWYLGYPDCAGDAQSPINLSAADEEKGAQLEVKFDSAGCDSAQLIFSVHDHHYKVSFDDCDSVPSVTFEGDKYEVAQLHIHSVSEHTIGSSHHDAEAHIVHIKEGTEDEYLVVGILMDASGHGDNVEIGHLWEVLNVGASSASGVEFNTSIYDLLPVTPSFIHYTGSLTTPPCTEGVTWIVMSEPVLISELCLDEYRYAVASLDHSKVNELGNTNRPTQPLNGRKLYYNA